MDRISVLKHILLGAGTALSALGLLYFINQTLKKSPPTSRNKICFLIDNGSYKPASTLSLRMLAQKVQALINNDIEVIPVSVRFSNKISISELDNKEALILEPTFFKYLGEGYNEFFILPAFLGPSETISITVPEMFESAKNRTVLSSTSDAVLHIAKPLVDIEEKADARVAQIVLDLAANTLKQSNTSLNQSAHLVLCDHGTPSRAVNAVRAHLLEQVNRLLLEQYPDRPLFSSVAAAAMESRPTSDYDFNRPLLEDLLLEERYCSNLEPSTTIVSLLFISPGKHAEIGGDVSTIIATAKQKKSNENSILMTPVLSSHEHLPQVLASRLREILLA
jgi:hypothetical protein